MEHICEWCVGSQEMEEEKETMLITMNCGCRKEFELHFIKKNVPIPGVAQDYPELINPRILTLCKSHEPMKDINSMERDLRRFDGPHNEYDRRLYLAYALRRLRAVSFMTLEERELFISELNSKYKGYLGGMR